MTYGFQTPKYLLPAPVVGNTLSDTDETRLALTIENNLFGGMIAHSGGHGIINVGNVVTSFESGVGIVTVLENKPIPAIEGFLNQIYFGTNNSFSWVVPASSTNYLIVQEIEEPPFSTRVNGSFLVTSNNTGVIPDNGLLVFVANTNTSGVVLDTDPDGRINLLTVAQHMAINVDPHTPLLRQTNLITSGLDIRGDLQTENLFVTHDLVVSGTTTLSTAIISGVVVQNTLDVFGQAIFHDGVSFTGNLTFGDASFGHVNVNSGLVVSGTTTFVGAIDIQTGGTLGGNIQVSSGVTIDGVDLSTLNFLINGSNADANLPTQQGHYHLLSGTTPKFLGFAPEYAGTVISGIGVGTLLSETGTLNNLYHWRPEALGNQPVALVVRVGIPSDFHSFSTSGVSIFNQIDSLISGNSINLSMKDTNNNNVSLTPSVLQNTTLTETQVTGFNGVFNRGQYFTFSVEMNLDSGIDARIGELTFKYNPLLLRTGL